MRTTALGSKGPAVGVIGLGCMGMTFSYDMETPRDDATSIAVIHQALDLGMTLIDTADVYGPFTIPGTKTLKYLAENAATSDVELSAADLAELGALPAPEGARY
jgi:aryl-alcohol dehydrogenase-like predicted oxidoreductase